MFYIYAANVHRLHTYVKEQSQAAVNTIFTYDEAKSKLPEVRTLLSAVCHVVVARKSKPNVFKQITWPEEGVLFFLIEWICAPGIFNFFRQYSCATYSR